jgi:hypothetical protein
MSNISPNQYFYLADGTVLKSIDDLKLELEKNCNYEHLSNFNHHVSANKNDYANWIKHVFGKDDLYEEIKSLTSPKKILDAIIKTESLNNKSESRTIDLSEINNTLTETNNLKTEEDENKLKIDNFKKQINNLSKEIIDFVLKKDFSNSVKKYKELKNIYLKYPAQRKQEKLFLKNKLFYLYTNIKNLQKTKIELNKQKEIDIKKDINITEQDSIKKDFDILVKKLEDEIKTKIELKDFVGSVKKYRELKNVYLKYPDEESEQKKELKKKLVLFFETINNLKKNKQIIESEKSISSEKKSENQDLRVDKSSSRLDDKEKNTSSNESSNELNNKINDCVNDINNNIEKKDFVKSVKSYRKLKNLYLEIPDENKEKKLKIKKGLFDYFKKIKTLQDELKKEIHKKHEAKSKKEKVLEKEVEKKIETPEEFLERISESADKLLEKTKSMKKNSYINIEKQKESTTSLRERYEDLYSKISDYRKKGRDMFVPYMHLRLIKPKLQFLEISNDAEDRATISSLLNEVEEDIKEAIDKFEPDLKKEVLTKAGLYEEKVAE